MNLLTVADLAAADLTAIIELAQRPVITLGRPLDGCGAALIFEKPSNRTRHSTEIAVVQLGGHPVYTRGEEIGFDERETVEDVGRILAGYHRVLAARVFRHDTVARLAASSSDAITVNLLSDHSHPLQGLADLLTMVQTHGPPAGRRVAFVGDWNNVARSLAEAAVMSGMHVRLGCPEGYDASTVELARIDALGPGTIEQFTDPSRAVEGADVVHTDTWISMGQEAEREQRRAVLAAYRVDEALMARAAPGATFMHCLPAHRGDEVSAAVIDGPASRVVQQGHNRLHAARGALAFLAGVRP